MGKSLQFRVKTPRPCTDGLDRLLAFDPVQFVENSSRNDGVFVVNGHRGDDQNARAAQRVGGMNRQTKGGHVWRGHQTTKLRLSR